MEDLLSVSSDDLYHSSRVLCQLSCVLLVNCLVTVAIMGIVCVTIFYINILLRLLCLKVGFLRYFPKGGRKGQNCSFLVPVLQRKGKEPGMGTVVACLPGRRQVIL